LKGAMEIVRDRVARRVTPGKGARVKVEQLLNKFIARAKDKAEARGLKVRVEVEGSIAKDTWIGTEQDVDIFLIFPLGTGRELVGRDGLELAKACAGKKWSLGYAEHPYVEAEMDGFTLDIVPSVEMREGEKPITSVDRTPLHTRFVGKRLDAKSKTEVRVLKQFLKGIGVYGAELKIGGFSGYLAELLVINFGSFAEVVRAAAGWGDRAFIDIVGHYKEQNLGEVFDGNLVVVDPVDMARNAAAAVSCQAYFTFVAAARHFLEKPSIGFFFPGQQKVEPKRVMDFLASKGSHLIAVVTSCPNIPSDILWGEAFRAMKRLASLLEEEGFPVNDSAVWSDEKGLLIFIFELHGLEISKGRLHLGPMVSLMQEADSFLGKYRSGGKVLAGPYIKGDRWVVELRREENSAASLLAAKLKETKFSRDIGREFKKGYKILVDGQIEGTMKGRLGLAIFMLQFLRKRPPWLNR